MDLIDPTITHVGIAARGKRVWIHTECGPRRPWEGQGWQIFPPAGTAWSYGLYCIDNPDPRPKGVTNATGVPVTCARSGIDGVSDVKAELFQGGRRVPCWRNDSTGRDLVTNHPSLRATLMGKKPLKRGPYRLVLTWTRNGRPCRLEHRFKIGSK